MYLTGSFEGTGLALRDYSWMTQNSFPSGSANMKVVPQSSFLIGRVILTPFPRRRFSSRTMSFVPNRNPVFPFSGRASGQRCMWTFEPLGATVTQCGHEVTTRKPTFSFQNLAALFSFRTTTATVSNVSMSPGIGIREIRPAEGMRIRGWEPLSR